MSNHQVGTVGDSPELPNAGSWRDYVAIARPDHWFKNVFMLAGVLLACFYYGHVPVLHDYLRIVLGLFSTCLIASSNYVINEFLDAPYDRAHPTKRHRPVPSGKIRPVLAILEWLVLGLVGLLLAWQINNPFFWSGFLLWIMGLVYNVPPIRSKDLSHLDVLSESVNNPLRLLLGWFVLFANDIPPLSLVISYWMLGAFFMASKRFAEFRAIGERDTAAAYRRSFRYYSEETLLTSMVFYAMNFALFLGIFIIRYRLELILAFPLVAGFISYYLHIALKPNSVTQRPESLYRERGLMVYLTVCVLAFLVLMVVHIEPLYPLFNVTPETRPPLWRL